MVCYWMKKHYPDFSFQFWTFSHIHIHDDWKLMLFCMNILSLTGDNCISNSSAKSGKLTCRFKSYIIAHIDCCSFNFPFLEKNLLNFLNWRNSRNWATDSNLAVKGHLLWHLWSYYDMKASLIALVGTFWIIYLPYSFLLSYYNPYHRTTMWRCF